MHFGSMVERHSRDYADCFMLLMIEYRVAFTDFLQLLIVPLVAQTHYLYVEIVYADSISLCRSSNATEHRSAGYPLLRDSAEFFEGSM